MRFISLYFTKPSTAAARPLSTAVAVAQIFTPRVACLHADQVVLLDIEASLALFNGPGALYQRLLGLLQQQGLQPVAALAPTAQGAVWLSQYPGSVLRRCLVLSTLHRRLDALQVQYISSLAPWHAWLQGIGCTHLGQLRRLPRQALQQRTAPSLLQALDYAYGHAPQLYTWEPAPEHFNHTQELDFRLENATGLLYPLQRLVDQACLWLNLHQWSCRQLHFLLHHEKGRKAQPPTVLSLAISEPAWQTHCFLPVLKEQLGRCGLPAPVIAVTLRIDHPEPRALHSTTLFPEPGQWQRNEQQLFDLLRARLGSDNLLTPRPRADHRPEIANGWAPMAYSTGPANQPGAGTVPTALPPRPFFMFAAPQPLTVVNHHPTYNQHTLTLVQGPERIESGWWEANARQARDYFIAQDAQGMQYWVFRPSPSRANSGTERWFLHGLFA